MFHFVTFVSLFPDGETWPSGQFYHLKVAEDAIVYSETHEGAHLVESVDAGSAGVDVEGVDGAVVHHLEDV